MYNLDNIISKIVSHYNTTDEGLRSTAMNLDLAFIKLDKTYPYYKDLGIMGVEFKSDDLTIIKANIKCLCNKEFVSNLLESKFNRYRLYITNYKNYNKSNTYYFGLNNIFFKNLNKLDDLSLDIYLTVLNSLSFSISFSDTQILECLFTENFTCCNHFHLRYPDNELIKLVQYEIENIEIESGDDFIKTYEYVLNIFDNTVGFYVDLFDVEPELVYEMFAHLKVYIGYIEDNKVSKYLYIGLPDDMDIHDINTDLELYWKDEKIENHVNILSGRDLLGHK